MRPEERWPLLETPGFIRSNPFVTMDMRKRLYTADRNLTPFMISIGTSQLMNLFKNKTWGF